MCNPTSYLHNFRTHGAVDSGMGSTMAIRIPLSFFCRRQNTNIGDDQYRIWAPRSETEKLAVHIPELAKSLARNDTYSWRLSIRWKNGACPPMVFGSYADHSGQLAFTASKATPLFDFVQSRLARGMGDIPIAAWYVLRRPFDSDYLYLEIET